MKLTKEQPTGIALTFLLFLFIFFYKPTWGATTWIWTSEVFSMNVRAQAVGMCSQWQNVSNLVFNQFFPIFLAKCSFYTFYFFGGINCLLALFVLFIVPETRGIVLEEMDVLFGGVNHVEKGGAQMGIEDTHHIHAGDNEKLERGAQHNLGEIEEVVPARPVTAKSDSRV
jgi:hypothetical protein